MASDTQQPVGILRAITPALKAFRVPHNGTVVYDESKHEIIVINGNNIQISPIYRGNTGEINYTNVDAQSYTLNMGSHGAILSAKRSAQASLIACRTSERDLIFWDVGGNREPKVTGSCSLGKKKIRAFYWIDDSTVLILTSASLETYRITASKRQVKRISNFTTTIDTHCFNSKKKLVVCRNHLPHKLKAFKLFKIDQGTGHIEKQQKTLLEPNPPAPADTVFTFARMHSHNFVVIADATKHEAYVYHHKIDYLEKQCILNLEGEVATGFSVANNLLCVHCAASKVTLLFDILIVVEKGLSQSQTGLTPAQPIVHVPMSKQYINKPENERSGLLLHSDSLPDPYGSDIEYIMPNVLLDYERGLLFVMAVNVEGLAEYIPDTLQQVKLLLHRRGSKDLVLRLIKEMIKTCEPLSALAIVLNTVNQTYLVALKDRDRRRLVGNMFMTATNQQAPTPTSTRNSQSMPSFRMSVGEPDSGFPSSPTSPSNSGSVEQSFCVQSGEAVEAAAAATANIVVKHDTGQHPDAFPMPDDCPASGAVYDTYDAAEEWQTKQGLQVIQQLDIYKDVFFQLYEDKTCSGKYLNSAFMEYVRSLSALNIPLQDFMHRFMIDMLIYSTPPDYHRLHQYLQYHVIEDHIPIALQLLKFKDQYAPSFQLAMDMLSRLKAHGEIVEVLLSCSKLVKAVEIMIQYQVRTVSPCHILEKAVSMDNDQLFYAVFQLLEKYNLETRGCMDFLPQDRCQQYVTLFNERFKNKTLKKDKKPSSPTSSPRF